VIDVTLDDDELYGFVEAGRLRKLDATPEFQRGRPRARTSTSQVGMSPCPSHHTHAMLHQAQLSGSSRCH